MNDKDESLQNKYNAMRQGTSTTQVRHKIKEKFISTLQGMRQKSIDTRRFSNSSDSTQPKKIYCMKDLRDVLSDNKDLNEVISPEEIDKIFEELQEEAGWKDEDEIDVYDAEIQAAVDNLLTNCAICDKSSEKVICESCANEHFTDSS